MRGCEGIRATFHWQTIDMDADAIHLMTDSDWARDRMTRKSKSGGVLLFGSHVLHHWCKSQSRVAKSSAEASFLNAGKGLSELLGLGNLMEWMRMKRHRLEHSLDAQATIAMLLRQGVGTIRHLTAAEVWCQDAVRDESITLHKIPRADNWSDSLCSIPNPSTFPGMMHALAMRTRASDGYSVNALSKRGRRRAQMHVDNW